MPGAASPATLEVAHPRLWAIRVADVVSPSVVPSPGVKNSISTRRPSVARTGWARSGSRVRWHTTRWHSAVGTPECGRPPPPREVPGVDVAIAFRPCDHHNLVHAVR